MRSSSTSPSKTTVPGARIAALTADAVVAQVAREGVVARAGVERGEAGQHVGRAQHPLGRDVVEPAKADQRLGEAGLVEGRAQRDRPAHAFHRYARRRPRPLEAPEPGARWRLESWTDVRSRRSCATRSPHAPQRLRARGIAPRLVVAIVGEDPASQRLRAQPGAGRRESRGRRRGRRAARRGRTRPRCARGWRRSARIRWCTGSSSNSRCRRTWASAASPRPCRPTRTSTAPTRSTWAGWPSPRARSSCRPRRWRACCCSSAARAGRCAACGPAWSAAPTSSGCRSRCC